MVAIIGGAGAGLLDSSLYLLNRKDQAGAANTGNNESIYANVSNGDLVIRHADALLPSQGEDYALVRTYNSSGHTNFLSSAGKWTFSSMMLDTSQKDTNNKITLFNSDGSDFLFTKNITSGLYISVDGAGAYQTISYDALSSLYTLTRSDQTKLTFNGAGLLTKSQDTNDNIITYGYTGNLLTSVKDDVGHTITYKYTGNNLTSLVDETNTVLAAYGYDSANNLVSSTDRAGRITGYHYVRDLSSPSGYLLDYVDLPTQTDKLLITNVAGADSAYYLDWRKRLGIVYKVGDLGATSTNLGQGKAAVHLSANDGAIITNSTSTNARRIQFEYANPVGGKGSDNDKLVLSALVDAEGNRTEFSYSFTLSGGAYAGGSTRVVSALGLARATSNQNEFTYWRKSNGYYEIWNGVSSAQSKIILDANTTTYSFNKNGAIIGVTDTTGYTTRYEYDANENLTKIIDANADAITKPGSAFGDSTYFIEMRRTLGYLTAGGWAKSTLELTAADITSLKDHFTTVMTYDDRGNLLSQRDGEGNITTYTYTAFNKLATQTTAMGNALAEKDSAFLQQKRLELNFINLTTKKGKTLAELSSTEKNTLRALFTTTYKYSVDGKQNLVEIDSPSGGLTKFSNFNIWGNPQTKTVYTDNKDQVTTTKQLVTMYLYDAMGNVVSTTEHADNNNFGATTSYTYDRFGNRLTMKDAMGGLTSYTYDSTNRLLTVTDPEGNIRFNTYDAVGNLVSIADTAGQISYSVYDKNNRLVNVINPSTSGANDRSTSYGYDVLGDQTYVSNSENQSTYYRYNESQRLVEVTRAPIADSDTGSLTYHYERYQYDAVGNRIWVEDERNNHFFYSYNGSNLLVQSNDNYKTITRFSYDANLNQVEVTSGVELDVNAQHKLTRTYDEANQLVAETDALGFNTTYVYDDAGRKVKAISAMGNAIVSARADNAYYKDLRQRLGFSATLTASEIPQLQAIYTTDFSYVYNATGLLVTETKPPVVDSITGLSKRNEIKHQFDKNGNEVTTTNENGKNTTYSFDKDSRLVMVADANNVKTVYGYDSRGNKTSVQIGVVAAFNPTTRKVTVTNITGAEITTYRYNEFNQLSAKTDALGNALVTSDDPIYIQQRKDLGFTKLDANGLVVGLNVIDIVDETLKNKIRDKYTETYVYDTAGNLTKRTNNLGVVTQYAYDKRNRLISMTEALGKPAERTTQYLYDENGNRAKTIDANAKAAISSNDAYYISLRARLGVVYATGDKGATAANLGKGKLVIDLGGTDQQKLTNFFTTTYDYDEFNRLVYTNYTNVNDVLPLSTLVKSQTYDHFGNMTTSVNGNYIAATTNYYDKNNKPVLTIDAQGYATGYVYDANGNLISQTLYDKPLSPPLSSPDVKPVPVTTLGKDRTILFNYDSQNHLIERVDAEGYSTRYTYDDVGNLVQTRQALDLAATSWATTYHFYDSNNREVWTISPEGYLTEKRYDLIGNIKAIYVYDQKISTPTPGILPTPKVGDTWHATLYNYDADNRVTRETRYTDATVANQIITDYTYDQNGNRKTLTIAAGSADARTTTYAYDDANRLIQTQDANQTITRLDYDANGNVVRRYEAYGTTEQRLTSYSYDTRNLLETETNALGAKTFTTYDAVGNVKTRTRAYGTADARTDIFEYDGNNRLLNSTDASGVTTVYVYDAAGNRITTYNANLVPLLLSDDAWVLDFRKSLGIVDANNNGKTKDSLSSADTAKLTKASTTSYTFDRDNRLILEEDTLGTKTQYTYDGAGNRKTMTMAQGVANQERVFTYEYEKDNHLISITAPIDVLSGVVRYGITRFEYDVLGNKTKEIDADENTRTYSYDKTGRLLSMTDAVGNALAESDEPLYVQMRKDLKYIKTDGSGAGKLVGDLTAAQQLALRNLYTTRYVYDKRGNRIQETDHTGTITTYSYDILDRMLSLTQALGTADEVKTIYEYDKFGNRTKVIAPNAIASTTKNTPYFLDLRKELGFVDGTTGMGLTAESLSDAQKLQLRSLFTTQSSFNALNQLVNTTDGKGIVIHREYNALNLLRSKTLAYGRAESRKTSYVYTLSDRLYKSIDPLNRQQVFEYDALGNRVRVTDEYNQSTRYIYDAMGRNVRVIDALNFETQYTYDAIGNRISITNAKGGITKYDFDLANRAFQITDAENRITRYSFDNRGNKIAQTTAFGNPLLAETTTYEYDAENHLLAVSVADANGWRTTNQYDRDYNLKQAIDANGNITTYEFDALNRTFRVTDALKNITTYEYDANSNRIQITNALKGVTRFIYDQRNATVSETSAIGNGLADSDAPEFLAMRAALGTKYIDPVTGLAKSFALLTDTERAELRELYTTHYTYYSTGEQLNITDAKNGVRSFYYDTLGRLTKEIDAEKNTTTYAYDGAKTIKTDARKHITTYFHDELQRVSQIDGSLKSATFNDSVVYKYDGNGNRIQVITGGVITNTSYYDKTNKLTLSVDGEGYATGYNFDNNGNLQSQTLYAKALVGTLNLVTQPTATTDPVNDQTISYKYDKLNRVILKTDAEGYITQYTYDVVGNLKRQDKALDKAATLFATTYHYYDKNNRETWIISPEGYLTEKRYDTLNRLTALLVYDKKITVPALGVDPKPIAADTWHSTLYTYDNLGQVIQESKKASVTESIITGYTYDANGNRLTVTEAVGTSDARTTTYGYDKANRLTLTSEPIDTNKSRVTRLELDENGNVKIRHEADGTTEVRDTTFTYDDNNRLILETGPGLINITKTIYDEQGNIKERILGYGTADQRSETYSYYRNNRLKAHTNAAGEIVSVNYDAAGNRVTETNPNYIALTTMDDDIGDLAGEVKDYYINWRVRLGIARKSYQQLTALDRAKIKSRTSIYYVYDRNNQLIKATDANRVITKYTYDGAGNKLTTTQAVGLTKLAGYSTDEERTTEYQYDKDNRLTKVIDPLLSETIYNDYDVLGNQKKVTNANGNITLNTYDQLGRLMTSISGGAVASTRDIKTVYTYDKRSNITSTTQSFADGTDTRTTTYTYDLLNRKTSVTDGEGFTTSFVYDRFGNQTQIINGQYLVAPTSASYDAAKTARAANLTSSFSYDAANRMLTMTDGEKNITQYEYDRVSNRTKMTEAKNGLNKTTPRSTLYTYDKSNRISSIATPAGGITLFSYDAEGNKIKESVLKNNVTTYTIPQGASWNSIAQELYEIGTDQAGTALLAALTQNAAGAPELKAGNQLSPLPESILVNIPTPTKVDPYFIIPGGGNQSEILANLVVLVYGSSEPEVINAVIATLANNEISLTPGDHVNVDVFPESVHIPRSETVNTAPYYVIPRNASWSGVIKDLYTSTDPNNPDPDGAIAALKAALGGKLPSLTDPTKPRLTGLPATLTATKTVTLGPDYYMVTSASWSAIFDDLYGTNSQYASAATRTAAIAALKAGRATPGVNTKLTTGLPPSITVPAGQIWVSDNPKNPLEQSGHYQDVYAVYTRGQLTPDEATVKETWKLNALKTTDVKDTSYDVGRNTGLDTDLKDVPTLFKLNLGVSWINHTYEYDSNRNLTAAIDPYSIRTEHYYDAMGNRKETKFAAGTTDQRSVWMEYDWNNRKTADLDGYGKRTTYDYDKLGNRIAVTDALNNKARYYYDTLNQLTFVIDPDGVVNSFVYDAAGNRKEEHSYKDRYIGSLEILVPPALSTAFKANERKVTSVYDKANRLVTQTDADGTVTKTLYDGSGHIKEETLYAQLAAPAQRKRSYLYDANGRLKTFTDVDGTQTAYTYDGANNKTSEIITSSTDLVNSIRKTEFEYDLNNRRTREKFTDKLGKLLSDKYFSYDLVGNLTSLRTALSATQSETTTYSYDNNGNRIGEAQETGDGVIYGYDKIGNRTSTKDGRLNETIYIYDLNNRQIKEIKPTVTTYSLSQGYQQTSPTIETVYDDLGNVVQTKDANGNWTTFYYDRSRHVIAQIGANKALTEFTYDTMGNLVEKFEFMKLLTPANPMAANPFKPNLHSGDDNKPLKPISSVNGVPQDIRNTTTDVVRYTRYEYDMIGRLINTILPKVDVTHFQVAPATGTPSSTVDKDQKLIEAQIFDAYGNLRLSVDRANKYTRTDYDINHRKIAALDPMGYLTTWEYDQQGNKTKESRYKDPLVNPASFMTDASLVSPITLPTGEVYVTDYLYDGASRLLRQTDPEVTVLNPETLLISKVRPTTVYTYDMAGNLFSTTKGANTAQAITDYRFYDKANRLIATVDGQGIVTAYDYDEVGNKTSQYRYLARYSSPITSTSSVADIILTVTSAVAASTVPGKPSSTQHLDFTYDSLNRLESETDRMVEEDLTDDLTKTYRYDAAGNRTLMIDEEGYETQSAFGANGQISQVITPDATSTLFEYDTVGNLIKSYLNLSSANVPVADSITAQQNGNNIDLNWNAKAGLETWVAYDSVSHSNATNSDGTLYPSSTAVQVANGKTTRASLSLPATGSLFFRVITRDSTGNTSWSAEQTITLPPSLSALSIAERTTSILLSATFDTPLNLTPRLIAGTAGNLASVTPIDFVRVGTSNVYTATLQFASAASMKTYFDPTNMAAYKVSWSGAGGEAYNTEETRFAWVTERAGISTSIGSALSSPGATSYNISLTTRVPLGYAENVAMLQIAWRKAGSSGNYETMSVGSESSSQVDSIYNFTIGADVALNPGDYELVLKAVKKDGSSELLDTFTYTTGTTILPQESISWNAPNNTGTDQLAVVGGMPATTRRQVDDAGKPTRRIEMDTQTLPSGGASDYVIYYGDRLNSTHTVTARLAPINASTVQITSAVTLTAEEANNISGSVFFEYSNDGGSNFLTRPMTASAGKYNLSFLSSLGTGTFRFVIWYKDKQGNQVVIERQQLAKAADSSTVDATYTGASLTVSGRETGIVTKSASGILSLTPNPYYGKVDVALVSSTHLLYPSSVANSLSGTAASTGTSGYFTQSTYNALNYKTSTNEQDGIYREFGVNETGAIISTMRYGTDKQVGEVPLVVYNNVDARGRVKSQFKQYQEFNVAGSFFERKGWNETSYEYNLQDQVTLVRALNAVSLGDTKYEYNAQGAKIKETDVAGNSTYSYVDQFGRTTGMITPQAASLAATAPTTASLGTAKVSLRVYDKMGNLTKEIDPLKNATVYRYDYFNRKIAQTDGRGAATVTATTTISDINNDYTTFYTYDNRNRLIAKLDPVGWHLANDDADIYNEERYRLGLRRTDKIPNPLGGTGTLDIIRAAKASELTADEKALLLRRYTTNYAYDGRGNLIESSVGTGIENQTTLQTFDSMNRVISTSVGTDMAPDASSDASHTLTLTSANTGDMKLHIDFPYAEMNNIKDGILRLYGGVAHSGESLPFLINMPRTSTTSYEISFSSLDLDTLYGIKISYTDKQNREVIVEDQSISARVASVVYKNPSLTILSQTQNVYDGFGNKTLQTDANGNQKSWNYGAFARLKSSTDEDGNITGYEYDDYGRVNREYSVNDVDGTNKKDVVRTYLDNGEFGSITDKITGTYTMFTYTRSGLLNHKSVFTPKDPATNASHSQSTNYSYDALGRMTFWGESINGASLNIEYDKDGNRTKVYTTVGSDPLGKAPGNASYQYYNHVYGFDDAGRLTSETDGTTGKILAKYTYDQANNRKTWVDTSGSSSSTWTYSFDANNRVSTATAKIASVDYAQTWAYDSRGNLLEYRSKQGGKEKSSTISAYNTADRALVVDTYKDSFLDQKTITNYDTEGQVKQLTLNNYIVMTQGGGGGSQQTKIARLSKSFTYNYDYYKDGREKSVVSQGAYKGTSTSLYDGNKNKVKVDQGKGTGMDSAAYTSLIYDNQGHVVAKLHDDGINANGRIDESLNYFYDANGNPLGRRGKELDKDGKIAEILVLDTGSYSLINAVDDSPGINTSYAVQAGDTLQGIANSFYGNSSLWYVIANANSLDATQSLKEGTTLKIPTTDMQGHITSLNHALYREGEITGSSLPSLVSPPPPKPDKCAQITAIVVIVIIAVAVAVVTAGAGAALAGLAVGVVGATAGSAGAAIATVTAFAVAGAAGAVVGSLAQQTVLIGAGLKDGYDYNLSNLRDDLIIGGISGAASGLGSFAGTAAKLGKLSQTGSSIAKASAAALQVASAGYSQLYSENSPGKITSWTGLAAAALGSYISTSTQIQEGLNARFDGSIGVGNFNAAKTASSYLTGLNAFSRIATPFVQMLEKSAYEGKNAGADDWINVASATLNLATDKFVDSRFNDNARNSTGNSFAASVAKAGLNVGGGLAISAIYGSNASARTNYIENNIGHEIGTFIGGYLEKSISRVFTGMGQPKQEAEQFPEESWTVTSQRQLDQENPYEDLTYKNEDEQLAILEALHQENFADARDEEIDGYFGQLAAQQDGKTFRSIERNIGEGMWQMSQRSLREDLGREPTNSETNQRMLELGQLNGIKNFNNMSGVESLNAYGSNYHPEIDSETLANAAGSYDNYLSDKTARDLLESKLRIKLSYDGTSESTDDVTQSDIVKSVLHAADYGFQTSPDISGIPSAATYIGQRNPYRSVINLRITDADSGNTRIGNFRNPYFDSTTAGTAPTPALIFSPGWSVDNAATPIDGNLYLPHSYDRERKLASAASRVGFGTLGVIGGVGLSETGLGAVVGIPTVLKSADEVATGTRLLTQYMNGNWGADTDNYFVKTLKWGGVSDKSARIIDGISDIALAGGAIGVEKMAAKSSALIGEFELRKINYDILNSEIPISNTRMHIGDFGSGQYIGNMGFALENTVQVTPQYLEHITRLSRYDIPEYTFRGDSRPYEEIFENGFRSHGNSYDVYQHVLSPTEPPSGFIATSKRVNQAANFGTLNTDNPFYIIRTNGRGVDVNAELGPRSVDRIEQEVAIRRFIPPTDILGVKNPKTGEVIFNPNYNFKLKSAK